MKITVSLDTQAVITQPSPLRFKGGCFNPVEIGFTRGSAFVPLPNGAVIEFSVKAKNQWTGGLLAYQNTFTSASGNLYSGMLNCATVALLTALGLSDQVPANDVAQVDASAEVTWSFGGEKLRSITFAVTIEAPITDAEAAATPDPVLYPSPSEVARKSDIPVVGSAAQLDAGTPNGAATLDGTGKLIGAQVPDTVAFKSDLIPNGSNRIVIGNRFALEKLPITNSSGDPISKVNIGDVVHQTGIQGTARSAVVTFSEYTITDDNVNYYYGVRFFDENGNCASFNFLDFGGAGAVISGADFANSFANTINAIGMNAWASVTGDGQVTVTGNTTGPLPGSWSFSQDEAVASYAEIDVAAALPPGDFLVADLNNLGNATGFQGIGNTVDFLSGYGSPTADIGEEGNGYVDQNNGDFYHRDASGWQFVLNIKGPQGAPGLSWRGTWSGGANYNPKDAIFFSGSAYVCVIAAYGESHSPTAAPSFWTLLAQQGNAGAPGAAGESASRALPIDISKVALLRPPYTSIPSYTPAYNPQPIGFDGTNLWVYHGNGLYKKITKLKASDMSVVGTYDLGNFYAAQAMCFDGTNIWGVTANDTRIAKITASTGAATFYTLPSAPYCPCFDGTNLWGLRLSGGVSTLYKIRTSDGVVLGTYSLPNGCTGLIFDGTYLWTSVYNNGASHSFAKIQTSDGTYVTYDSVNPCYMLCFDGKYFWTWVGPTKSLVKVDVSSGLIAGIYATTIATSPNSLCFDGEYLWMDISVNSIYHLLKFRTSDGALVKDYNTGIAYNGGPIGLLFDGTSMWWGNGNNMRIYKF